MITLAIHDMRLAKPGSQNAALRDYDSVRRAIAFISEHWRTQPSNHPISGRPSRHWIIGRAPPGGLERGR